MTPIHRASARVAALLACTLPLWMGCATPTAVSSDSQFKPNEGLVALRLVEVTDVPISRFTVVSEKTGEEYPLRAIRFGQVSTDTYVGSLPAGRYRPKELTGSRAEGMGTRSVTVPLTKLTGQFDIEAGRVTQLGTMVFMKLEATPFSFKMDGSSSSTKFSFALPLDPTPVPVEAMLAARFPQLAKSASGKTPLGWVGDSVPPQPAGMLDRARRFVTAQRQPAFVNGTTIVAGGSLGVISKWHADEPPSKQAAPTVHAITTVLALQDGRWLAGGEEGYLALSGDEGKTWQPLSFLSPEEVVLHLMQRSDGRLLMVTDRDRESVVYESSDNPIAWKELQRLPSDREQGAMMKRIGESAYFLPGYAASTKDRLVVFTHPYTVNTLDLKTGQWESHATPRTFGGGIKLTADGYLVGISAPYWMYGSTDFGKNWKRLEAWIQMTEPHFYDRRRGVMLAAETELTGGRSPYKIRTTDDGGATWKTGDAVKDWYGHLPVGRLDPHTRLLEPLWASPDGQRLYTADSFGRIKTSRDGGRTWN